MYDIEEMSTRSVWRVDIFVLSGRDPVWTTFLTYPPYPSIIPSITYITTPPSRLQLLSELTATGGTRKKRISACPSGGIPTSAAPSSRTRMGKKR